MLCAIGLRGHLEKDFRAAEMGLYFKLQTII